MFQYLTTFLYTIALASVVFAQTLLINQPQDGESVSAGSSVIVQLAKPSSLTGSEEVSVVIGAFSCSEQCPGASEELGTILYSGNYSPEYYPDNYEPYQNFTVTIPSWYSGTVQLGVAHFFLLGAGSSAQLQLTDAILHVAASQ